MSIEMLFTHLDYLSTLPHQKYQCALLCYCYFKLFGSIVVIMLSSHLKNILSSNPQPSGDTLTLSCHAVAPVNPTDSNYGFVNTAQ